MIRSLRPKRSMEFKIATMVWSILLVWMLQSTPPNFFDEAYFNVLSPDYIVAVAMSYNFSFDRNSIDTSSMFDFSIVPMDKEYYNGSRSASVDKATNIMWLIPDPNTIPINSPSVGRVIFKTPIKFFNDSGVMDMSFNISVNFEIITKSMSSGEGMAIFIAQDKEFPNNSSGGYLGLSNATFQSYGSFPGHNFFAVEFDIAKTAQFDDPSSSHVGIDINSLKSMKVNDTFNIPTLSLNRNLRFHTLIKFNSLTSIIHVWLKQSDSTFDTTRLHPILATKISSYSLRVFTDTPMWVGITATSEKGLSGYAIHSWGFSASNGIDLQPASGNPHKKRLNILSISIPVLLIVISLAVLASIGYMFRSRKRSSELYAAHEAAGADIQQFSYNVLKRATKNFSEKMVLGEGGFSKVYKGLLSGQLVAIKKLKDSVKERGGEATFASEVRIISSIRHRNLLGLKGWCYEKGRTLLVYEYAENGSLEKLLYKKNDAQSVLTSDRRWKILVGVATALEYLHEGLGECVIHRDVKAANVLLNKDWEPMLGDFGLARLVSRDQMGITMTAAGTTGYIAPEVLYTRRATEKADVYSFGILALEVACNRRVFDFELKPEESNLLEWVWILYHNDNLMDSLDPCMLQLDAHNMNDEFEKVIRMWKVVLHVALNCCQQQVQRRPSMREVRHALIEGDLLRLPMGHIDVHNHQHYGNLDILECTSNVPSRNSSFIYSSSL